MIREFGVYGDILNYIQASTLVYMPKDILQRNIHILAKDNTECDVQFLDYKTAGFGSFNC